MIRLKCTKVRDPHASQICPYRFCFSPLSKKVRDARLTYLNPRKFLRLEAAAERLSNEGVKGDFCEFGVALGGSGIVMADYAKRQSRAFHGFDVFEMIPPPESEKDGTRAKERYETIASGTSEGIGGDIYYGYIDNLIDKVKGSFAQFGVAVDGEAVVLHQGLFEDSWPGSGVTSVALAHIDCDWYDPVKYCLEQVADLMAPGAMFLIDDYNDYGGARLAVDEFIAGRPDFMLEAGPNPYLVKV